MSNPNKVAYTSIPGVTASMYGTNMIVSGHLVFLSGVVGNNEKGLIGGTIQDRTRQAIKNAQGRLNFIGLDLRDVVTATIYLSAYERDFASMNEAWFGAFPKDAPLPCRTCIGVARLPSGTDIEINFTAALREKSSKL